MDTSAPAAPQRPLAKLRAPHADSQGAAPDVRQALAQLDSAQASERLAAERWLGEHLTAADLPALAEGCASASAETRRRLERALGSDERHIDLAALLLSDRAPQARALGESALARLMAGWIGEQGLEPAPELRVLGALNDPGAAEYRLRLEGGPLAPLFESVVRLCGGGVGRRAAGERIGVALDPRLADSRLRADEALPQSEDGDFVYLLFGLCTLQKLELEGFGLDWQEGRNLWLHVTSAAQAGRRRADQLVATWLRAALDPAADDAGHAAACRALAGTGWSAALGWLERRWNERGDGAALDGLALAASCGRVAPSLATPDAVRRLLAEVDAALAEGGAAAERRADRGRFALGALPAMGVDGSDLAALVAERLDSASARERFVRLAVLARMGVFPQPARAATRSELEGRAALRPPAVELEALRALAASRPFFEPEPWGRLARASELLDVAAAQGQEGAVSAWMRAARLGPPESWREPSTLPAAWDPWRRLLVAEAWLAFPGGESAAAAHLGALGPEALCDPRVEQRLRRLAQGPLRAALAQALAPESEALGVRGRLALLAGILAESLHPRALSELVAGDRPPDPCSTILLGALAAGPVRDGARSALLEAARKGLAGALADDPLSAPWARACERAWSELSSAGLDEEAQAWLGELRRMLREAPPSAPAPGDRTGRGRPHPLLAGMLSQRWPRLASAWITPLTELESPLPAP